MPTSTGVKTEVLWGRRVRERRKALGLSQEQVARLADCTQVSISKIELGQSAPRDSTKVRVARALGCRVTDLFPWEDAVA